MVKQVDLVEDKDTKKKHTKFGGYRAKDIMKAPVEPVEPATKEDEAATDNKSVVIIVLAAAFLGVCGAILSVTGQILFGGFLLLVAALMVLAAVFLPIGVK